MLKADKVLRRIGKLCGWEIAPETPTAKNGMTLTRGKMTMFVDLDRMGRLQHGRVYESYAACGPNKTPVYVGPDDKNKVEILADILEGMKNNEQ
jgi:hypothetical protein